MTVTENSVAHPIEDFVWCENCARPHPADFEAMTLTDGTPFGDGDGCVSIQPDRSGAHASEWDERTHHATYAKPGYDLWLKSPPLQPFHHPMYYLEKS